MLSFQQMVFSIGNYFSFVYYLVIKHRQIEGKASVQCVFTLETSLLRNGLISKGVDVVVQFYPWFEFYFLLFLDMVMYDNEFKTKENKI